MGKSASDHHWETWYAELGAKLFLFARQFAKDEMEAEDIVQDAFLRVWNSEYDAASIRSFHFFRAVRWAGLDRVRSEKSRSNREAEFEAVHRELWFEEDHENREVVASLSNALQDLPDHQREVVVLKLWGDQTYEQIGELLSISPNTAASRYRYGLEKLKDQLGAGIV